MIAARPFRVFLAICPAVAAAQNSATAGRIVRVERGLLPGIRVSGQPDSTYHILDRMRRFGVPGVSIAVIDGGRVAWAHGYGVLEAGTSRAVDTLTTFLAGSISKPVAATAALRMVERAQLALDADVNTRLTSWKLPESEFTTNEKVTLRRLLSHSAGLTVHGFGGYAAGSPVPSLVQVLNGEAPANSAPVGVNVVPGTIWRYSGGGATVAQVLMSDVSGTPFPRLMRDLVLLPAGMTHSTFENPLPAERARNAATGHERPNEPVAGKWHTYPEMFAAGLWTTPSDLARWSLDIMRASRGGAGLLSPAMAKEMLTVQKGEWGLGVQIVQPGDSAGFTHSGRDEGFVAAFLAWPIRNQGVVIMTNGTSSELLTEIAESVAREYGWRERPRRERPATPADTGAMQHFVGRYRFVVGRDTTIASVIREKGAMVIGAPPLFLPGRVFPDTAALRFFSRDTGMDFLFARRPGAPADSLTLIVGGRRLAGPRVL